MLCLTDANRREVGVDESDRMQKLLQDIIECYADRRVEFSSLFSEDLEELCATLGLEKCNVATYEAFKKIQSTLMQFAANSNIH